MGDASPGYAQGFSPPEAEILLARVRNQDLFSGPCTEGLERTPVSSQGMQQPRDPADLDRGELFNAESIYLPNA